MQFKDYDPKLFRIKRNVLGLTMEELATASRTTRQTVGNIERGRVKNGPSVILIGLALDGYAQEKCEHYVNLFERLESN